MKKLMLSLTLATLAFSTAVLAQDGKYGSGDVSGTTGRPASLDFGNGGGAADFLSFLFNRIHTLGLDGHIQDMKKDGVTERKYIAGFEASGALVYEYELTDRSAGRYNDTGRNVGVQLVPYTIKYSADGSVYLAINPVSLKNMIALQSGRNAWDEGGFYEVVDNMDYLVLKWDNGMSFDNIKSFTMDIVNTDLKIDVLNASKKARYLAFTAGGAFGVGKSDLTLDSGEVIKIRHEGGSDHGMSFRSQFRYGLEYNDQWNNGSRLNLKVGAQHTTQNGYYFDKDKVSSVNQQNASNLAQFEMATNAYNVNVVSYKTDKLSYEQTHLNGTSISEESYKALTGKEKPVSPKAPKELGASADRIVRQQIYLTPSIEFSKRVSAKDKKPVRMGLGVNANIPLVDTFQGGKVNLNMQDNNRNFINARLFINF